MPKSSISREDLLPAIGHTARIIASDKSSSGTVMDVGAQFLFLTTAEEALGIRPIGICQITSMTWEEKITHQVKGA